MDNTTQIDVNNTPIKIIPHKIKNSVTFSVFKRRGLFI